MKWGTPRERNHSSTFLTTSGSAGSTTHQCGGRDSSHALWGRHGRHVHRRGRRRRDGRQGVEHARRPGPGRRRRHRRDGRPELLAHGTTVATNALLQRRGAVVALVTNRGFADVIEIARQDRPSLYDQWADRPEPLVPRHLRLEVGGRLDATGTEIEPVGARSRCPRRRRGGRRLPPPRRPQPGPRAGGGRRAAGPGPRRHLLVRRLPRVPGVRAHGDHRPQRLPPPGVPRLPPPARRAWPTRSWS